MRTLWRRSPATVGEVLETINADQAPGLAYTTVMTVLSRLHEKGYVRRRRVGRGYEYEPAYTENELVDLLGKREVSEIVDRYGRVALAHFAATLRETDPDVLRDLEALREDDQDG